MASNNDNGEMFGFAVVVAVLAFIGFFLYAVLAFLAIVLTVIAILAWNKPLTLGKTTVQPADARAFVGRGILGAIALPVFAAFCELLFDFRIEWEEYGGHIVLGGYILGSIGLEMMEGEETPQPGVPEYLPPQAPRQAAPEQPPFRFATWDDEADEASDTDDPCRGCAHHDDATRRPPR